MNSNKWLICTTFIPPYRAGAGENAYRFAQYLTNKNEDVTIFSFHKSKPTHYQQTKIKIQTLELPNETTISRLLFRIKFPFSIFRKINRAQIIFFVGPFPGYQIAILLARLLHKKIVFRSLLLGADDAVSLTDQKNWLTNWLTKLTLSQIDIYIAINSSFYNNWQKILNRKGNPYLCPQGVNTDLFKPSDTNQKKALRKENSLPPIEIPILISVGNITKRKGYEKIFKALSELNEEYAYIILGESRESSHEYFWSTNNEMNELMEYGKEMLGKKVHFLGYKSNPEEFYKLADIFVGFSNQEGLPNALLEAMSCGLPTVYGHIEGVTGWITTQSNSITCNNENDFKNAVLSLIHSKVLREELGNKGRQTAEELLSFEYLYRKII